MHWWISLRWKEIFRLPCHGQRKNATNPPCSSYNRGRRSSYPTFGVVRTWVFESSIRWSCLSPRLFSWPSTLSACNCRTSVDLVSPSFESTTHPALQTGFINHSSGDSWVSPSCLRCRCRVHSSIHLWEDPTRGVGCLVVPHLTPWRPGLLAAPYHYIRREPTRHCSKVHPLGPSHPSPRYAQQPPKPSHIHLILQSG